MKFFKKKRNKDIDFTDYSFIESKNLADLDHDKLDSFLEKPMEQKTFTQIFIFFIIITLFFLLVSFYYQFFNFEYYQKKALANFKRSVVLFSDRGVVFDKNGKELIWNESNEQEDFSKRAYIEELGFSHLLGFLSYPQKDRSEKFFDKEYVGKGGVEKHLNEKLNGVLGKRNIVVNSRGNIVSNNVISKSEDGENIFLSINSEVQKNMAIALEDYIKKHGFVGGSAAVMDIENGKIISMISLPEYSSKILTEGEDREKIQEYVKDQAKPFLNKFVYGEFVPGSVVKPFIALMALENNIISANEKVYTNGSIVIPNIYNPSNPSIFRDWKNHGVVDLKKAIASSSNVYFYLLSGGLYNGKKGLGIEKMEKEFEKFNFGKEVGFEFFSEKKGQIPNPEWKEIAFADARPWSIGNTYYTSIGQFGFLVTPAQILVGAASIANNGEVLKPKILKDSQKEVVRKLDYSLKNFEIVKEAMRETVLSGTTRSLNFDFLKIATKSGTAQIKGNTRENSWIMGFFPYDEPKYAFVFLAEDGPNDAEAGVSHAARDFFLKLNELKVDWKNL